eukprot:54575-Chlamydomonas_euryale.AAC.1
MAVASAAGSGGGAAEGLSEFQAAPRWTGERPGYIFKVRISVGVCVFGRASGRATSSKCSFVCKGKEGGTLNSECTSSDGNREWEGGGTLKSQRCSSTSVAVAVAQTEGAAPAGCSGAAVAGCCGGLQWSMAGGCEVQALMWLGWGGGALARNGTSVSACGIAVRGSVGHSMDGRRVGGWEGEWKGGI